MGRRFSEHEYFTFGKSEIVFSSRRPASARGALRGRHERGAGCGGRFGDARRAALEADGEGVWSWRPDAGAKFSREAIVAKVTGAREPGPRGEHEISRKPSRRECRLIAAYLWLLTRVLFVAHAAAGALRTRHSLRPLIISGVVCTTPRVRFRAARMRPYVLRHCEERSDEAIHSSFRGSNGLLR